LTCSCLFFNVICINRSHGILYLQILTVSASLPTCQDSGNGGDCCLCSYGNQLTCNNTCPSGYLKIWAPEICDMEPDDENCTSNDTTPPSTSTMTPTTTASTTTTTVPTTTAVTQNIPTNGSDDNSSTILIKTTITDAPTTTTTPPIPEVLICIRSCDNGTFYEENQLRCQSCDSACLSCTGLGKDNCTVCRFTYKNECVSDCPENTKKNDTVCMEKEKQNNDDEGSKLFLILGVSIGGVVLLSLVAVVVVICVRRRRATPRRGGENKPRRAISVMVDQVCSLFTYDSN